MEILKNFPEQIEEGIKIGENSKLYYKGIDKVVIAAMGGSAIAGEILSHFARIPYFIVRDYQLPPFIDASVLFVAVSYSGNTAETISCFKEALKRGCKCFSISSGGKLSEISENHVFIPPNMQPRMAIAYLLFPLAKIFEKMNIIEKIDYKEVLMVAKNIRDRMKRENIAKKLAEEIDGIPIIYGYDVMGSIAKRWRQQFNENSKIFSFNFTLPECNHNEIEAWEGEASKLTCIFLRGVESKEISKRFEFMKKVYAKKAKVIEVFGEGNSRFAKAISLMYIGDLVSLYMALRKNVNPFPVNLIMKLKNELSTQDPHH
ncbi:MAG TPA: bifunctional phosphoglucose/phosphomannose isomerase [Calditrichaeota bacterium]|nr:bifunctional phosphoglucose/phosphomannose isomerase [Calditrichota bacterium]